MKGFSFAKTRHVSVYSYKVLTVEDNI